MSDPERNPVEELAEEFLERTRRGEHPTVTEYALRYPEHASEIEELFPAMLLMERCKPADVRPTRADSPGAPAEAPRLERLGDYRIVREVGRGGMGIVYEAEQESLGRRVALKILPESARLSPRQLRRFQRESQAAANLHHTNIVQVFGVGEQDGHHYYVMQFIEGRGLDEVLAGDGERPDAREAARLALQAARALEHAHARGVLHRDVKPANLLLDDQGSVWITDFGLAKVLAEPDDLTRSGDVLGTIRYMAPERFEGRADERSDLYGLGLTLYELLTGRPAFDDRDRLDLLRQVREEAPPPPRRLDPSIPRDLETITLRAIARDPDGRYAAASDLAEDLERFLADRPILARRVGPVERLWRWCRRNRLTATLAATAAASLLLAALAGWIGYLATTSALERESQRRTEAEEATAREEANVRLSLEALEEIFETISFADDLGLPRPSRPGSPEASSEESIAGLLQSVVDFYDRFAASNETNPRLRLEAARAHRRVGTIRERLGQPAEAEDAFGRAVAALEALATEFPEDTTYRHELAETLPLTAARPGDPGSEEALDAAERRARRAAAIAQALVAAEPADPRFAESLAKTHARLARILARADRATEASEALDRAAEARRAFEASFGPALPPLLGELARAHEQVADGLLRRGRPEDARRQLEAALEELEPAGHGSRRGRAGRLRFLLLERLVAVCRELGDDAAADEAARRSLVERGRLRTEMMGRRGPGRRGPGSRRGR